MWCFEASTTELHIAREQCQSWAGIQARLGILVVVTSNSVRGPLRLAGGHDVLTNRPHENG